MSSHSAVHHHRFAPTLNSCRCLNLIFTLTNDPELSDGEKKAVDSLFGLPERDAVGGVSILSGGAGSTSAAASAIFADGYFAGRLQSKSAQQESLVFRRAHPLHHQWSIERCLNCHLDVLAVSAAHQLVVVNNKAYSGDEIRKWRETDIYSKHFNVLLRHGAHHSSTSSSGGGIAIAALATSPGGVADAAATTGSSSVGSFNPASSPAIFGLKSSLDSCLEAERIAMETRLSQMRALEEQRFAEVENKVRHQFAVLVAQIEREQESGPLAQQQAQQSFIAEGLSPRSPFDPFARRNSRMFGVAGAGAHGKKGSSELSMFADHVAAAAAASAAVKGEELSTSSPAIASMSPTRVVDIMQQASASRGISPAASMAPLSRTSSRDSVPSPLGTSSSSAVDDRAGSSAAVVAVPLDLRRESPTTPSGQTRKLTLTNSAAKPAATTATTSTPPTTSTGSLTKNIDHLPAPPVLTQKMDVLQLEASAASGDGISLVPFDDSSAPSDLLHSLSNFDDFTLPTTEVGENGGSGNSAVDDAIFDLDEEQLAKEDAAELSPALKPLAADDDSDGGLSIDDEDEDGEEDEMSELSDEEMESRRAPVISSKAAKLLGMDDNGGRSASGSISSTTRPPTIIRPRTLSGSGVNMVQMSLPVAIPSQLRQMVDARAGEAAGMIKGTPNKPVQSALGRSLQARAALSSSVRAPAPVMAVSQPSGYSSDEEDGGAQRRPAVDDGAFVPPHTLVDEPFFSFVKVQHLGSFKEKPRTNAPTEMRVQRFDAAGGSVEINGSNASSLPFSNDFVPISSSVPRMVGSLGARQLVTPSVGGGPIVATVSAGSVGVSKLGFGHVPSPPTRPVPNPTRGQQPSSRNPTQQQASATAR